MEHVTQRVKNKYEIIIKDLGELKLGIIIFMETKKDSGLMDSFIFIMKCLKRSEQRDGFLILKKKPLKLILIRR